MKKIVCFIFLVSFLGCVSLTEMPQSERSYQKVFKVNLVKNEIYDKTLDWMAKTFASSKKVIELKDRRRGKIIGNGSTKVHLGLGVYLPATYTLLIQIKKGRVRLTYSNFIAYSGEFRNRPEPIIHEGPITELKTEFKSLSDDYYNYLSSGSNEEESW